MKDKELKHWLFMAICCALGIVAKKLISPLANIVTEALHIPGGISTAFSLMFIVIASEYVPGYGTGAIMGIVQSAVAVCMGTVGSLGALAPLGYIAPGVLIDLVCFFLKKDRCSYMVRMVTAAALSSVSSCLITNAIVFHLKGAALLLYMSIAALSGVICGIIASWTWEKLIVVAKKR